MDPYSLEFPPSYRSCLAFAVLAIVLSTGTASSGSIASEVSAADGALGARRELAIDNGTHGEAPILSAELASFAESSETLPAPKPRIINTTDLGADPDDEQSLVRQLVMASEFDIEGLIVTTGCWKKSQSTTYLLDRILNAYAEAYPNLTIHSQGFPTPEYLRSISVMGQRGYGMSDVGAGKDSPGSNLIIEAVDRDDPRPVWATCWGGCNTIAQALWKVMKSRTRTELEEFIGKLRVYDVLGQDDAGTWIAKTFPDLLYIRATAVFGWQPSDSYLDDHIQSHGPLGGVYPDREYATEGDSPAFMHLANPGLNDPDRVSQGGWGGRFDKIKKTGIRGMRCMNGEDAAYDPYRVYGNPSTGGDIIRWSQGYDNDFQARMDWSVTDRYSDANHHPDIVVNGVAEDLVMYLKASPGSVMELSALGSSDPDGDDLEYSWSFYEAASSYRGSVSIEDESSPKAIVQIPPDARGKEIHIILTLGDNGTPHLYRYRRAVIAIP